MVTKTRTEKQIRGMLTKIRAKRAKVNATKTAANTKFNAFLTTLGEQEKALLAELEGAMQAKKNAPKGDKTTAKNGARTMAG